MKYIIALADGCADTPVPLLGTPLHYANTPCLDALASSALVGQTCLIPPDCTPGSLPALLTLLGAPEQACHSSRAALEALGLNALSDHSTVFRCNFISIRNNCIVAHDGDGMTQTEADTLIAALSDALNDAAHTFLNGVTYRALLLFRDTVHSIGAPPPDTLIGQPAEQYLPQDTDLCRIFHAARQVLANHPINIARQQYGKLPINAIWLWGGGTPVKLPSFPQQTGLSGGVVSGVPLVHGIARAMELSILRVAHTDGTLYTNWEGKAFAAFDALNELDFVLIHVEAPDEAGHTGSFSQKTAAIEYFDQRLLAPLIRWLAQAHIDYRLLILPDHPTPISLRCHTRDFVPFLLYDSLCMQSGGIFDECYAKTLSITPGKTLLNLLLKKTHL